MGGADQAQVRGGDPFTWNKINLLIISQHEQHNLYFRKTISLINIFD